jgi:hypothetical protein
MRNAPLCGSALRSLTRSPCSGYVKDSRGRGLPCGGILAAMASEPAPLRSLMFKTVAPYSFVQRNRWSFVQRNRWLAHLVHCVKARLERLLRCEAAGSTAFQLSSCAPFLGNSIGSSYHGQGPTALAAWNSDSGAHSALRVPYHLTTGRTAGPDQGARQTIDGTAIAIPLLSGRLISRGGKICRT